MIRLEPYNDQSAWAVLSQLDMNDLFEAHVECGAPVHPLELFSHWRNLVQASVATFVCVKASAAGSVPFAVVALARTGAFGEARAALLARDHKRFRPEIARAVRQFRRVLPDICRANEIHRVEARCWADHPTAPDLLVHLRFGFEAELAGFGRSGVVPYLQFARLFPPDGGESDPVAAEPETLNEEA